MERLQTNMIKYEICYDTTRESYDKAEAENARLLSFRLWDEVKDRWVREPERFAISADGEDIVYMEMDGITFRNDLKVTRFIGVSDCEGVPIYEGDIIEIKDVPQGPFVVTWNPAGLRWSLFAKDTWYDDVQGWVDNLKIVGNIFEDYELLEGTDE